MKILFEYSTRYLMSQTQREISYLLGAMYYFVYYINDTNYKVLVSFFFSKDFLKAGWGEGKVRVENLEYPEENSQRTDNNQHQTQPDDTSNHQHQASDLGHAGRLKVNHYGIAPIQTCRPKNVRYP